LLSHRDGVDDSADAPYQTSLVLLGDDIRGRDRAALAALDPQQQAENLRARAHLHDYVFRVIDRAIGDGQDWLSDMNLTSWENLRELMAMLVGNAENAKRGGARE